MRIDSNDEALKPATVVLFWLPLAATWLMMAAEGPYLAAIVARMPEAARGLAAYGVATSLAWLVESPIMMLLSASAALVRDRASYFALRRFTFLMCGGATAAMGVLDLPRVFAFVGERLIELPRDISHLAHVATTILVLWPAAIGYRRFYQGILVRHHLTRRVAYGTVVRLIAMSVTAALLAINTALPGATLGAIALLSGVIAEALASRWMARHVVRTIVASDAVAEGTLLDLRALARFYFPLALTSILSMATGPLVTFGLGRGGAPIESLAVWPVIVAMLFLFRSGGVAFQEVGIALAGNDRERGRVVTRTAVAIGAATSAALAVVAFTPLAEVWLGQVSGLSTRLTEFAIVPVRLLILLPALEYLLSMQRLRWIVGHRTGVITVATAIEAGGLAAALLVAVGRFHLIGAIAGSAALMFGRISANAYLLARARRR